MGRYASSRNYGYGKQLAHAGKTALRDHYGQGHHSTVATHSERWTQFAVWAREQGVRDVAKIDNQELAATYAQHMRDQVEAGEISVATAQNRISSVNTIFAALRGDRQVQVSPSEYAGSRSAVRTEAPAARDIRRVQSATEALREAGLPRAAAVLELARTLGVRREEAVKADLDRWSREAARHGAVNVLEGTKGGRDAPRWVPIGEAQRRALASAVAARPDGSHNLIAPHERYAQLAISRGGEIAQGRAILQQHGLPGYHDARAAYACQRYEQITGCPAPAVA
ncbi:integrase domain-containing protein, partial [Vreelandella glaciei]|uniref:integrase domain-containing protein n=1 Tax=Vreelandella glaciei TaxID=186761 RepID=UPI0030021B4A